MQSGSSRPNRRRISATGTYGRDVMNRRRLEVLGRLDELMSCGRVYRSWSTAASGRALMPASMNAPALALSQLRLVTALGHTERRALAPYYHDRPHPPRDGPPRPTARDWEHGGLQRGFGACRSGTDTDRSVVAGRASTRRLASMGFATAFSPSSCRSASSPSSCRMARHLRPCHPGPIRAWIRRRRAGLRPRGPRANPPPVRALRGPPRRPSHRRRPGLAPRLGQCAHLNPPPPPPHHRPQPEACGRRPVLVRTPMPRRGTRRYRRMPRSTPIRPR